MASDDSFPTACSAATTHACKKIHSSLVFVLSSQRHGNTLQTAEGGNCWFPRGYISQMFALTTDLAPACLLGIALLNRIQGYVMQGLTQHQQCCHYSDYHIGPHSTFRVRRDSCQPDCQLFFWILINSMICWCMHPFIYLNDYRVYYAFSPL